VKDIQTKLTEKFIYLEIFKLFSSNLVAYQDFFWKIFEVLPCCIIYRPSGRSATDREILEEFEVEINIFFPEKSTI
jgi:hypothetical protein